MITAKTLIATSYARKIALFVAERNAAGFRPGISDIVVFMENDLHAYDVIPIIAALKMNDIIASHNAPGSGYVLGSAYSTY